MATNVSTATTYLIPLTNQPQTFEISLAGIAYLMTIRWNSAPESGWQMDLADATTGDSIAASIPLITGADLLAGLEYLMIGGELIVYTNGDATAVPTLENMGTDCNLYFVTNAASN